MRPGVKLALRSQIWNGSLQCGEVRLGSVHRRSQWLSVCRAHSCEHETNAAASGQLPVPPLQTHGCRSNSVFNTQTVIESYLLVVFGGLNEGKRGIMILSRAFMILILRFMCY